MTTTIAATHHPTASNQDILTRSAPVNISPRNCAMVLNEACNTIVSSTLPRVLLNIQALKIPNPAYPSINGTGGLLGSQKNVGRCQEVWITPPTIKAA
jgi:hypothetical protein